MISGHAGRGLVRRRITKRHPTGGPRQGAFQDALLLAGNRRLVIAVYEGDDGCSRTLHRHGKSNEETHPRRIPLRDCSTIWRGNFADSTICAEDRGTRAASTAPIPRHSARMAGHASAYAGREAQPATISTPDVRGPSKRYVLTPDGDRGWNIAAHKASSREALAHLRTAALEAWKTTC